MDIDLNSYSVGHLFRADAVITRCQVLRVSTATVLPVRDGAGSSFTRLRNLQMVQVHSDVSAPRALVSGTMPSPAPAEARCQAPILAVPSTHVLAAEALRRGARRALESRVKR